MTCACVHNYGVVMSGTGGVITDRCNVGCDQKRCVANAGHVTYMNCHNAIVL